MLFRGWPAAFEEEGALWIAGVVQGPKTRVEQVERPQNQDARPPGRVEHSRARTGVQSSAVERKSKPRGEHSRAHGRPVEHSRAREARIPKYAKMLFGFSFAGKFVGSQRKPAGAPSSQNFPKILGPGSSI